MSEIVVALLFALFPAAELERPAQDDDSKRVQQLLRQAEQQNGRGDTAGARKSLAEAWALTAKVYWKQGNRTAAESAFRTARKFGWEGPHPSESARPAPRPAPQPRRPAPPPPRPRVRQESPTPRFEQRRPSSRRRRMNQGELWKTFAMDPYRGPRKNAWHALVNTPAFEAASVIPRDMHKLGLTLDLATADYTDGSGATTTTWHAAMSTVSLEYDYGLSDQIQLGGRLVAGELAEVDDDDIVVYDGANQIIPAGERDMGLASLVLRGKWATPTSFADLGALLEVKIPLADEDAYLTSQSFDIGLSGLLSKRWESVALHLNVGFVLPFGDSDLFTTGDDVDFYLHGGAGLAVKVFDPFTLLAQLEFNTSAFGDVSALDAPVSVLSFGGRYRLSDTLFLSGAVGFGLGDESGDLMLSMGADFFF